MKQLSWKAVRNGGIFCAPACGGNCTFSAYQNAKFYGAALASSLGPGYRVRVWENLGWHYCAISPCRRIKVMKHGAYHFTAFLGDGKDDNVSGMFAEHGRTAKAAVRNTVAAAKRAVGDLNAMLIGIK